jgi:hypothetical protein
MTVRPAHGNAAKNGPHPRVEVLEARRLPPGVVAPEQADPRTERDEHGRFLAGSRRAQVEGGRARKYRTKLAESLGLTDLAEVAAFAPFLKRAEDESRDQVTYLASYIGGGIIGPDVVRLVRLSAMQSAASSFLFALAMKSTDPDLLMRASKLGNDGRQNDLAARELAAKGAKSRPAVLAPIFGTYAPEDDADDAPEPDAPVAPAEGLVMETE